MVDNTDINALFPDHLLPGDYESSEDVDLPEILLRIQESKRSGLSRRTNGNNIEYFSCLETIIFLRSIYDKIYEVSKSQIELIPSGTVSTSTTYYADKIGTSYVYHGATGKIAAVYSKLSVVDTGASQPTTDVTINGTTALTGAIANSGTLDTEVSGTIDTAADDITDGDVIELSMVQGTNVDASGLNVSITIQTIQS